jgi:UDPglucose 6-dehydrogenase
MSVIAVIGQGYVGLTTSIGLSSLGHKVIGIDINEARIRQLQSGQIPIHEPGLQELMHQVVQQGLLSFSSSFDSVSETTEFAFICVATPTSESGKADLKYVDSAIKMVADKLQPESIIVIKSTVPIGASGSFSEFLSQKNIGIASNPEFLSEGNALFEFQNPSRIVVGADEPKTQERVMALYDQIEAPRMMCGLTSAETIKHASNSFLAIKLSYVNELAALCEKTGAVLSEVTYGMSLDTRIGDKFLKPGPGWGGSCFPKDTAELAYSAKQWAAQMLTVEAAIESNSRTKERIVESIISLAGGSVAGKTVAIWGLAFKANTDDTRDSPAVHVAKALSSKGARIKAYDPIATSNEIENATMCSSALDACAEANVLVVLTEWKEFGLIPAEQARELMASDAAVFDTRNILDAKNWSRDFANFVSIGL